MTPEPVRIDEIVPLQRYRLVRDAYRRAVIEHKRHRRLAVGDKVTLVFEDHETLLFQIQEMLWIERIAERDKVQAEIDVYNELLPGPNELSATLFIEITEAPEIRPELDRLVGIDEHVSLRLGEGDGALRVAASFDPKQAEEDRISAVQYIRFRLDDEAATRFADLDTPAAVCIDHPAYRQDVRLGGAVRESLRGTLTGDTPALMPTDDGSASREATPELLFATERVRAFRLPGGVVVEAQAAGSFLDADETLVAELMAAVRRAAELVFREHGRCRVWTELGPEGGRMRWLVAAPEP
ncbi:MAG: DUF3501 family protein [Myxococcota bacterium]|nr:DUF3501 family protein [Myxococcota bacterium]